ncbi:phage tail tape measure protein [Sulfitobacter aestuarii]|uniref:Phage tail tape measure protein n=1 Tax=Sulfitobacter aestuarii TaxID=2161676 RepID=A0ABW5U573_9RHOB
MAEHEDIDGLEDSAEALNATLAQTGALISGFDSELRRMRSALAATGKDVAVLERGLSRGLRRAFDGVVLDGMKLSDALQGMAQSMVNTTYNAAMKPVSDHFGGLVSQGVNTLMQGVLPFAQGGAFQQGRVTPFAQGGVVSSATAFPMRNGMGLMGEAGPEAIMPLARGPDGKLGVRGAGAAPVSVVMNISTPDVQGFQRSQSQIAAQMSRALNVGNRNR